MPSGSSGAVLLLGSMTSPVSGLASGRASGAFSGVAQLPERTERHYFDTADGVAAFLTGNLLQDGDAVLVKGAHYSSQVFKVAEALKQYEEK